MRFLTGNIIRYIHLIALFTLAACSAPGGGSTTTTDINSTPTFATTIVECGHDIDPTIILYGYNEVVDEDGTPITAQGAPLREGYRLIGVDTWVDDKNDREYARIASYMMPIRDALMCDLAATPLETWLGLTEIVTLNELKTIQDLSGTPQEQVYSTEGIYDHLVTSGEDIHPMMKYLEEAELELKCLAFEGFDFINPEGEDHCVIHELSVGSGLILPESL